MYINKILINKYNRLHKIIKIIIIQNWFKTFSENLISTKIKFKILIDKAKTIIKRIYNN